MAVGGSILKLGDSKNSCNKLTLPAFPEVSMLVTVRLVLFQALPPSPADPVRSIVNDAHDPIESGMLITAVGVTLIAGEAMVTNELVDTFAQVD